MNSIGLKRSDYVGLKSTLCTGCGHDSVTNHIISAYFESGVSPYRVAKMSGIGCSSKTPAYFMNSAHGFNSIHGRMAPISTGAFLANHELQLIGISGDGDTGSIGLGSFCHLLRRNVPMVYIVENNGVYGLTKGQFSATADQGSSLKSGEINPFTSIDLCSLAIDMGCSFVARSFSGDAKQLVPLIKAAIQHRGTAFIDVISPCIAFANHEGSTKSYQAVREHLKALQELGVISPRSEVQVDYGEGETHEVELPDGSVLWLKKLNSQEHELNNPSLSQKILREAREQGQIITGLFHYDPKAKPLNETLGLIKKPLAQLNEEDFRLKKLPQLFR